MQIRRDKIHSRRTMGEAFLIAAMCTMVLLGLSMRVPMVAAQAAPQILVTPTSLPPQTIGQTFTLTVNLTDFTDLAGFQVVFKYNGTVLNATGVAFPSNYVFSSQVLVQTLPPPIDSEERGDAEDGLNWTMAGATLVGSNSVSVSNGILLEMNFTVIGVGETTVTLCTISNPVKYNQNGALPGIFYTSLLDVNYNEYNAFTTTGCTVLCGVINAKPIPRFTIIATEPPGGNKTNLELHAFPPSGSEGGLPCWQGEPTLFNASQSYAPTGNITAYIWSFGDGNTTVVNATSPDAWLIIHVYRSAGALTASLTVLSSQGANSSKLNNATLSEIMLVGMALPLYDWTPFLITILVIIVIAIVAAAVRSAMRHERRRRKLNMQARLTTTPTGQSSTATKPT